MNLLTRREVARKLRETDRTLDRHRKDGSGPPYVRIGRHVLYREDHLAQWLDARG